MTFKKRLTKKVDYRGAAAPKEVDKSEIFKDQRILMTTKHF